MDSNFNSNSQAESDEPRPQQSLPMVAVSVELQERVEQAKNALVPAEPKRALAELAACLTLVAPSGMSAEDRAEWLKVAHATINHFPAEALRLACDTVRRSCRRVSDLVPSIVEEAEQEARRLQDRLRSARWARDNPPRPQPTLIPKEDKPFSVDEIVRMQKPIFEIGKRNGWFEPDILAEAERIMADGI